MFYDFVVICQKKYFLRVGYTTLTLSCQICLNSNILKQISLTYLGFIFMQEHTRDASRLLCLEPNAWFVCFKPMERKVCVGVVNNSPILPPQVWVNTPLVSLKWDGWSYPGLNTSRFILLLLLREELKWRLRLLASSHTHTRTCTHTHTPCHGWLQWPGLLILSIIKGSALIVNTLTWGRALLHV